MKWVSGRAELRIGDGVTVPAWITGTTPGEVRLILREADAVAARGAPGVDVRFGKAHGSGAHALRSLTVKADCVSGAPPESAVVAVDGEAIKVPGLEVRAAQDVHDPQTVGALVVGAGSDAQSLAARLPAMRVVVLGGGDDLDATFFVVRSKSEAERLEAVVVAAVEDSLFRRAFRELVQPKPDTDDGLPAVAWYEPTVLRQRRATQDLLRELAARAESRIPDEGATVYAYDEWAEVLVGPRAVEDREYAHSAAAGLLGCAARTGNTVADSDGGRLAVPMRDSAGTVMGVITCESVAPEVLSAVRLFATEFAPALAALRLESQPEVGVGPDPTIFRAEAIAEQRRSESPSAILNVSERWGAWIVGGLGALLLAFAIFLIFGTATEYAEGSAVVHSRGRVPVVATEGGTVASVLVAPPSAVSSGDVIGVLHDHAELAQMERVRHEYEEALVRLLRDPQNPANGNDLAALRGASEQARADLENRQLVAPVDGMLTDVRVRAGALVSPGQTVATVATGGPGFEIVAAVPGNFRPLLAAGMPLIAELEQFPGSRFHLEVREVSPEVITDAEAHALMGQLLPTSGEGAALVLVYADLPDVLDGAGGVEYALYDGLRGNVRVPVREERFLSSLWPALRRTQ